MARVTRRGGSITASVWDNENSRTPIALFWRVALELDPTAENESGLAGGREGNLSALFLEAGLASVEATTLTATVTFAGFDAWWETFMHGVGPAGSYLESLAAEQREALRVRCAEALPDGSFELAAVAWAARGLA